MPRVINPGYPGPRPGQPYQPVVPLSGPRHTPGRPTVGDVLAGVALLAATGLVAGGSFTNLDEAVAFSATRPTVVEQTTSTGPWYFRVVNTNGGDPGLDLTQLFGVALLVGAVLALVSGVLLCTGLASRVRSWSVAAAALLFGAILATEMVAINDMQFDADGGTRTGFGLGFWSLAAAGLLTLAATLMLLVVRAAAHRTEMPTVPLGIPSIPYPAVSRSNYRTSDLLSGILLFAGTGLVVGGSFAKLDKAVNILTKTPNTILNTITTSPWYYRNSYVDPTQHGADLHQFFGVALLVGGAVAVVSGVLLCTGLASRVRSWSVAAAALLFGATFATEMSPISDTQFDMPFSGGVHSTAFELGFWLLAVGGLLTLTATLLMLLAVHHPVRRAWPAYQR